MIQFFVFVVVSVTVPLIYFALSLGSRPPAKYRMIFAKFVIVHGGWLQHIYQRSQNSFYLCFKINNLFYYRHFFSLVISYLLSFEWHTLCLDDRREKNWCGNIGDRLVEREKHENHVSLRHSLKSQPKFTKVYPKHTRKN